MLSTFRPRSVSLPALALLLFSSACSSGSGGNGGTNGIGGGGNGPGPGPSTLPAQLVGSWYAGSGHGSMPYDPVSGSFGKPTGDGLVYVFAADGSYTKGFESYVSNGGCTTGFTAIERGWVQATNDSLATYPSVGEMQYSDSCVPSLDEVKPIQNLEVEDFFWQLQPSEYDPSLTVLLLRRSDGAQSTFTPI